MSFVEQLDKVFQEKWHFKKEMPIQTKMVPKILEGLDVVAQSPTGTGKTLAYLLPLLQLIDGKKKQTQALVIVPSQELAMQITEVIREWIQGTDITVAPLIGGANMKRQIERLKKKPTIVVGTPGRLNELSRSKKLKLFDLRYIVLDEGDVLLSRDHRVIVKNMISGANHDRQVIVVSATITDEIERIAKDLMDNPIRIRLERKDLPYENRVTHSYIESTVREKTDILRGLAHLEGIHALAFINNVDQLLLKEMKLLHNQAPIAVLHANMRSEERASSLRRFRQGEASVLIATDLAARGLDIQGLTHVIHVDVPHTIEQYLHRSGRTGRAGEEGEVLTILAPHEREDYRQLTRGLKPIEKEYRYGKLTEKRRRFTQK